jgi:hypothetical protein
VDSDFGMFDDENVWTLLSVEAQVNEISAFSMRMMTMMTTSKLVEQVKILKDRDIIDSNRCQ